MKCRKLLFWALFSFFVLISISMVGLANEYKEVQASDILKQIENGEDVNLTDCRIIGELNLSKIQLETILNPKYYELLESEFWSEEYLESNGINKDLKVVESNITVHNSVFSNDLEFSSCLFNKTFSFYKVNCSSTANFGTSTFGNSADFSYATFGNSSNFLGATFGNSTNFSYATFGDSVNFWDATFGDSAYFGFTTFGDFAYFGEATFGDSAEFLHATFGDSAYFEEATFGDSAYFGEATFGDSAEFSNATFSGSVYFSAATFGNSASFWETTFGDSVDFLYATFGDSANFWGTTFGDSADFTYATFAGTVDFSDTEFKSVILDETDFKEMRVRWNSLEDSLSVGEFSPANSIRLTYIKLISNFRNIEQFDDADAAYFQYRKLCQAENPWISFPEKSPWISFPKVGYIFMWLSCGYGVKPSYTVGSSTFIIIFFSAIYLWEDLYLKGLRNCFSRRFSEFSGIISRLRISRGKNILNLSSWIFYLRALFHWRAWDAFYFSIASFTNSSYDYWEPEKHGRKLAVFEGFIGNLFIALFIVTLVNVLIRP